MAKISNDRFEHNEEKSWKVGSPRGEYYCCATQTVCSQGLMKMDAKMMRERGTAGCRYGTQVRFGGGGGGGGGVLHYSTGEEEEAIAKI